MRPYYNSVSPESDITDVLIRKQSQTEPQRQRLEGYSYSQGTASITGSHQELEETWKDFTQSFRGTMAMPTP